MLKRSIVRGAIAVAAFGPLVSGGAGNVGGTAARAIIDHEQSK